MRLHHIICGFALLSLLGCSASADMDRAEAAVAHFHQQLDAGQYQAIYEASGEEMKKATSQAELVRFLDAVHGKLGKYLSGKRVNWKVNYGAGGETVILDFQAEFENGEASEDFLFHIVDDKPILIGYHVNSNAFIESNQPRRT